MVKQIVKLVCKLENVTNLRLPDDEDWYFILQCGQCGEKTSNEIYFNSIEELEMQVSGLTYYLNYYCLCSLLNRVLKESPTTLPNAKGARESAQSCSLKRMSTR